MHRLSPHHLGAPGKLLDLSGPQSAHLQNEGMVQALLLQGIYKWSI